VRLGDVPGKGEMPPMNAIPDSSRPITDRPVVIGAEAYASQSYAREENEKLWPKVWQIACREEEIPEVGDYVTYDIVEESIIVAPGRTAVIPITASSRFS
jgi:hypothetical protein